MTKPGKTTLTRMGLLLAASLLAIGCGGSSHTTASIDTEDTKLVFDPAAYDATAHPLGYNVVNVTIDGTATKVRQWKIVYVANPVEMASTQPSLGSSGYTGETTLDTSISPYPYQTMIVSVSESVATDQKTPIYLAVNNSGWKPSKISTTITEGAVFPASGKTIDTDNIGRALKAGYIVVNAGTRSRELRGANGLWVGKAPAPVVDTKAIIRYLRLNDKVMPGSAERIVLNGTSGGGGLTTAVAASGNSTDYLPYLAEIGAAGTSGSGGTATSTLNDDVFATVSYCPIQNFANNDGGYEWQFNSVRSLLGGASGTTPVTPSLGGVAYSSTGVQGLASTALMAYFPTYLNGLKLKLEDGTTLLTDANMKDQIAAQVKAEAERVANGTVPGTTPVDLNTATFTANGVTLTNDWLTVTGTAPDVVATVTSVDNYIAFVAKSKALKTVVAFDSCGVTGNPGFTGESTMFGTPHQIYSNYNAWTWANNKVWGDDTGFDDTGLSWAQYLADTSSNTLAKQLKMISAVDYLTTTGSTPAPYWYVRHGGADRDESSNMQVLLYYATLNNTDVKEVSFKLPWLVPHSGNYDVQEAFTWIKAKIAANPLP